MLRNVNWFVGLLHYQTQVECFYFYLGLENFGIFESVIYLYLIFLLNIIYLTFLFNNNFFKKFKNNAAEPEIWIFFLVKSWRLHYPQCSTSRFSAPNNANFAL